MSEASAFKWLSRVAFLAITMATVIAWIYTLVEGRTQRYLFPFLCTLAAIAIVRWGARIRGDRRGLVGVLVVGLVLRLGWALFADTRPHSDFALYLNLARRLVSHGEFGVTAPFNGRAPGWPLILAGFQLIGLDPAGAAKVFNALISTATIVPIFAWVKQACGSREALLAAGLWAVLPSQIFVCALVGQEPLSTFLFACTFYYASQIEQGATRSGIFVGLLCAIGTYVRTQALLLPFILLVATGIRREGRWNRLSGYAIACAIVVVSLMPIAVRNQTLFGRFTPLPTGGGISAYMANNPKSTGTHMEVETWPDPSIGRLDEFERSDRGTSLAVRWAASNPGAFALTIPKKWYALFRYEHDFVWLSHNTPRLHPLIRWSRFAAQSVYLLLLMLATFGAVRYRGRYAELFVSTMVIVSLFAQHTWFHAQARYHAFALPALCLFAGAALSRARDET